MGGRTSPAFVRLYHKVEDDLKLTRLEVVLRKPRLQTLAMRDIEDLFRLDPHVLIWAGCHCSVARDCRRAARAITTFSEAQGALRCTAKSTFGAGYDVLFHANHVHVEYDP